MRGKVGAIAAAIATTILLPQTVFANIVWPSIYIAEGLRSWYIILSGLIIEAVFIKFFADKTFKQAGIISIVINAISTVVGVLMIPLVGFFGAIFIGMVLDAIASGLGNTFDTAMWICEYVLTVLTNVVVEGLAAKIIFKINFCKSFWWLLVGNAISVVICIIVFGFTLRPLM